MKSIIVGTMATTLLCLNACSQNTGVPESYKHLVDIQYRESKASVYPLQHRWRGATGYRIHPRGWMDAWRQIEHSEEPGAGRFLPPQRIRRGEYQFSSPTEGESPGCFIITAGVKDGDAQGVSNENSEAFKSKLVRDGHRATHEHFSSKSHVSLVMEFGRDGDPVSRAVANFLDGLKTVSLRPPSLISRLAVLLQRRGNSGGFHASAGEIISNSTA